MDIEGILAQTKHRPRPLPERPWVLRMSWRRLAFLHWPVSAEAVRSQLPARVDLDLFDGRAWIGVVPFFMAETRLRGVPPIPAAVDFEELNVRTYVRVNGRPGVWFFSLDAASKLAVRGARIGCGLPYYDAAMDLRTNGEHVEYRSRRIHRGAAPAEFIGRYRSSGPAFSAEEGSLEAWLTERYCLYTIRRGRLLSLDVHHLRWPLQPGEAEIERNTMALATGIELPAVDPLVHVVSRLDVLAWRPVPAVSPNSFGMAQR